MSTRTRVLFVTASTEPWGAEHSLRTLLGSAPANYSCTLLASSHEVAEYCRPLVNELRVVDEHQGMARRLASFYNEIAKISNQYDVIVIFSLKLLPLAWPIRSRWRHICVIADVHDAPIGVDRLVSRLLLRFVNGSIAISRFVIEHLKLKNATIVPRPIADNGSSAVRHGARDDSLEVVLGIVGRIDPEKRIEVAIDAMRFLPPRFKLNIYGDPCIAGDEYALELSSRAQSPTQTRFRGRMAPEDIYEEIDGLIVCNEREPSGRTVGEAMLRQKLVFAPDRGGSNEYFDDSISGFIYRALDAESLAQVVESAFAPARNTDLVRKRAREKVIAERSPGPVAEHYFRVLGLIASSS
ncbi:MAG: glycosyltransferase family 4 protein [Mycobacterium sp.]